MAFIYAADIWCDSCGQKICERIAREREEQNLDPIDSDDETSYDSDEFPKSASDDDESDCPQHCAAGEDCLEAETLSDGSKAGCLIGTNLTSYGIEYVKSAFAEGGRCAELWRERFDYIDFPTDDEDETEDE